MKIIEAPKGNKKETGIRLYPDQIQKLDTLVQLAQGRKKRSQFISEAIDEFLASRMNKLVPA